MTARPHLPLWERIGRTLAARPSIAIAMAAALLLVSLLLAFNNEQSARSERIRAASVQAHILAGSVAAALAFDDRATAQEYVDALRANPEIEAAAAYGADGSLRADFDRDGGLPPARAVLGRPVFSHDALVVTTPVVQSGARLGSVYLRAAVEPWSRRLTRYVGIAIVVVMASLLVAVLGASYASMAEAHGRLREETENRKKAEDALRQAQKMEAMGQLTGGVAHDFNNLLMVASSGLELLERTNDPAKRERLKAGIRNAIDRGAKLTQQLLTFARRSPLKPEVIVLRERLASLHPMLERSLREDVSVSLECAPGLWAVEVDGSQLDVALLNIAVNARDAMPDGGRITIDATNETTETGDFVRIAVRDEGTGIPPDMMEKIFEPFFTTKGVGHGTGLGLSQVYGFARSSGGTVEVDSEIGRGTTIALLLPRCLSFAPQDDVAPSGSCLDETDGPRCRVLLAEDDDQIAEMVRMMLDELGYDSVRVGSAAEAMTRLEEDGDIDLLLSDMVMPGEIGGLELARWTRQQRADLPVLLMTGYSAAAAAAGEEHFPLISKPYTMETLGEMLHHALVPAG